MINREEEQGALEAAAIAASFRTVWAVAVLCIVGMCEYGHVRKYIIITIQSFNSPMLEEKCLWQCFLLFGKKCKINNFVDCILQMNVELVEFSSKTFVDKT